MDKNIYALVREEPTWTVEVVFEGGDKPYTYLSAEEVKLQNADGSFKTVACVVPVQQGRTLKIAQVVSCAAGVMIEPNAAYKYDFVFQILNPEPYTALKEEQKRVEDFLSEQYKSNLRRSFRQTVIAELGLDQTQLSMLMGVKKDEQ